MPTRQRNDAYPCRPIRLAEDVTNDLYLFPFRAVYAPLHESGHYVRVGTKQSDAEPIMVGTWGQAVREAQLHCVDFIVSFQEKRVSFLHTWPSGGTTWLTAAPIPHSSIEDTAHASIEPYEPDAKGKQPEIKKSSGALKRKRAKHKKERVE